MAKKGMTPVEMKKLRKIYKEIKGKGGQKRTSLPGKEMVWKVQCTKAGARVRAYIWDREERVRIDGCADHYRNLNDFGLLQNYEKELQRTLTELVELSVGEYLEVTADMKKKQKGDEPEGRVMRAFRRIMSEAPELMDHHEWARRPGMKRWPISNIRLAPAWMLFLVKYLELRFGRYKKNCTSRLRLTPGV